MIPPFPPGMAHAAFLSGFMAQKQAHFWCFLCFHPHISAKMAKNVAKTPLEAKIGNINEERSRDAKHTV